MISISPFAAAADGNIAIAGNVTAQTCVINGNNSNNKDFSVTLPTVTTSQLLSTGQTAGRVAFDIKLSSCTPASGNVHTFFEPGPTVDMATGNLILATGGAGNVQIGLLNDDLSVIKIGAADTAQNSKAAAISAAGTATLPYHAQYVATGASTAGVANTSVMYSLVYQ
uniref:fimbrial protein n=1 Tax=Comamonas composti TaxID=408558 RepID=UPI00316ACBCC